VIHWHYFYKLSARITRLAIELGIRRGIVGLEESITSIIITGKLGAGEDTYLLECSTDQIGKVQLAT
jgi:hypothetical protein